MQRRQGKRNDEFAQVCEAQEVFGNGVDESEADDELGTDPRQGVAAAEGDLNAGAGAVGPLDEVAVSWIMEAEGVCKAEGQLEHAAVRGRTACREEDFGRKVDQGPVSGDALLVGGSCWAGPKVDKMPVAQVVGSHFSQSRR